MTAEFPAPEPVAIERISPSMANRLLNCALRVAFERDPSFRGWRRPSSSSALGDVAHAVADQLERFGGRASSDERREIVARIWSEQLENAANRLRTAWLPATPPNPEDWPGYHLTHARTIARAMRLKQRTAAEPRASSGGSVRPGGAEPQLEDPATGLWGRADQIEWKGSNALIVDLKSGLNQGEPTEAQRRQLLLYAAMVHAATGSWAGEIAIEDASGTRTSMPYSSSDAESAVAQVLDARHEFNRRDSAAHLQTGSPDPDGCRFCEFKVACGPYWERASTDWGHGVVWGEVLDSGVAGTGTFVQLAVRGPKELPGETMNISSVPIAVADLGLKVAVAGAIGSRNGDSMRMRWNGRVRSW